MDQLVNTLIVKSGLAFNIGMPNACPCCCPGTKTTGLCFDHHDNKMVDAAVQAIISTRQNWNQDPPQNFVWWLQCEVYTNADTKFDGVCVTLTRTPQP
jgi:hypothetical protein